MITEQDVRDLQACGLVAKWWHHRRIYYALKDAMLMAYGTFDGFVLQSWEDPDWDYEGEAHATHRHILMQYTLGGVAFHVPTNEFDYFNYSLQVQKRSDHYSELYGLCLGSIVGLKKYSLMSADHAQAYEALKRLVAGHGYLLLPLPDHAGVEIAPGVIMHVAPDIDEASLQTLGELAKAALKMMGSHEA